MARISANLLLAISLLRGNFLDLRVYRSMAAIRNSVVIVLAGIYLLGAGALARAVRHISPCELLPLEEFIIFMTLASLTVLLLSNRFRWQLRRFVSRHLHRPIYDCQKVWMELTERTASIMDVHQLSTA